MRTVVFGIALAFGLSACVSSLSSEQPRIESRVVQVGIDPPLLEMLPAGLELEFEPGSCPFELDPSADVLCGTVTVPASWRDPEGGDLIDLAVAWIPAAEGAEDADPVVFLEGGPGGHSLATLPFSYDSLVEPLRQMGDVIFFDQRGVGFSSPALDCPESDAVVRRLEDEPDLTGSEVDDLRLAALEDCRSRLSDDGIDLTDYDTANNARDVEALRLALGYDQWNLYGVSYGTRLGLEVLRRFPDGVRSAILDSVYPPQVDATALNAGTFLDSYELVLDACRAEPACAEQGDLGQRLSDLAQQLESAPLTATAENWLTGESDEVQFDGDFLVDLVLQSLYSPSSFSDLPELASDLEAGSTEVASSFLSLSRTNEPFFSTGMFYTLACRDEIGFADPVEVERLVPDDPFGLHDRFDIGGNIGPDAFDSCEAMDVGLADPSVNDAVVSDTPTLLMAGSYDPITPVDWAEQALATLSQGQLVVAPQGSHGVSLDPCGLSLVLAFLADPNQTLDAGCLEDEVLSFIQPLVADVELEEVSFADIERRLELTIVQPRQWETGEVEGDQYRSASFLDPTELHQLVDDPIFAELLAQFLEDGHPGLSIGPAAPFTDDELVGSLSGADLAGVGQTGTDLEGPWQRRQGSGGGVAVEWFEQDFQGSVVLVVLVAAEAEIDQLTESVLVPALQGFKVQSVGA